ncbi:MAG: hypothetical protein KBT03_03170 [Bacteroidales bacterium]|nr:hypothetical protein [Candidatus Scybalousia scybalohippi]
MILTDKQKQELEYERGRRTERLAMIKKDVQFEMVECGKYTIELQVIQPLLAKAKEHLEANDRISFKKRIKEIKDIMTEFDSFRKEDFEKAKKIRLEKKRAEELENVF